MIRVVAALAAAAVLLTGDPAAAGTGSPSAAAIGGRVAAGTGSPSVAAIGGWVAAGTGSPGAAAISAAAGKAAARRNALAGGQGAAGNKAGSNALAGNRGAPARSTAGRKTELTLSYRGYGGRPAAVVLRCHPTGGDHPKRAAACRLLTRVDGDPARLRPAALMCTLEYAPVTARIEGTWKGRRVDWSRRFGNRCEMNRTTRVLMAF
jgi:hypothetical protein